MNMILCGHRTDLQRTEDIQGCVEAAMNAGEDELLRERAISVASGRCRVG